MLGGTWRSRAQPTPPDAAGRREIQNYCCLKWLRVLNSCQTHQPAPDSMETTPNFVNQNHFSDIKLVFAEPYTSGTSRPRSEWFQVVKLSSHPGCPVDVSSSWLSDGCLLTLSAQRKVPALSSSLYGQRCLWATKGRPLLGSGSRRKQRLRLNNELS